MPYIYTEDLKWSYGGIRGRNNVAQNLFIDDGMSQEFVDGIINYGFSAVYIDTTGYSDSGATIIDFYSNVLNLDYISSKDGMLYLFYLA